MASYFDATDRWYVFANRVEAVIFKEGSRKSSFSFVQRLSNPSGHLLASELGSDRPGKGSSSAGAGTIRHALERRSTKHDHDAKRFAERIAQVLAYHETKGDFSSLVLAAGPQFLGLLRRALSAKVKKRVVQEINREYLQVSDQNLQQQVRQILAQ